MKQWDRFGQAIYMRITFRVITDRIVYTKDTLFLARLLFFLFMVMVIVMILVNFWTSRHGIWSVLDELMTQSGGDLRIGDLFTKGRCHRNLCVIYIIQNIFHQGGEIRNISLNAHYIVLFKSPLFIYEKLWGSDKASSRVSHAGFKTHNRWPTSIKNERTARRKYHWSTKPGPL